jgi:hypothetical protein
VPAPDLYTAPSPSSPTMGAMGGSGTSSVGTELLPPPMVDDYAQYTTPGGGGGSIASVQPPHLMRTVTSMPGGTISGNTSAFPPLTIVPPPSSSSPPPLVSMVSLPRFNLPPPSASSSAVGSGRAACVSVRALSELLSRVARLCRTPAGRHDGRAATCRAPHAARSESGRQSGDADVAEADFESTLQSLLNLVCISDV